MRRAKGEFYPGAGDRVAGSPKLRGTPHECGKVTGNATGAANSAAH